MSASSALVLTLLFSSASAPEPDACTPSCRDGYTCIDGSCVSACNPGCDDGERCVTTDGLAACVGTADSSAAAASAPEDDDFTVATDGVGVCRPACDSGETCLRTSSGYRCLGSASAMSPPPAARYQPQLAYRATAKAPALTLGVLSLLSGLVSVGIGSAAIADSSVNDGGGAFVLVSGLLWTGLGLWGIIGGANDGYVSKDRAR